MLKIILDTNLFKRKCLNSLEDYELSNNFEILYDLISKGKIQDTEICVDQVALLEYIEQVGNWYVKNIVNDYDRIFKAIQKSYPAQKLYFKSKETFIEEYKYELLESLKSRNIKVIEAIPTFQEGGVSIVKVIEKAIKGIPPFDKKHNKDLKDALISESVNTKANTDPESMYVFITVNGDDFKDNVIEVSNYKIECIHEKDPIIQIFDIINLNGAKVNDEVYYSELIRKERFNEDIKTFLESKILEGNYYDDVPIIKTQETGYMKGYDIIESNRLRVKFYLLEGDVEYECGIEYDISTARYRILRKYINCLNDVNEEVCIDEF